LVKETEQDVSQSQPTFTSTEYEEETQVILTNEGVNSVYSQRSKYTYL